MQTNSARSVLYFSLLFCVGLITSNVYAAEPADKSLVAHLAFNEGKGVRATDTSGRGHHAKLNNTEWEEFGLEGTAVRLAGDRSYIDFGKHEDFNFTQEFTLSIWIKAEEFKHGSSLFNSANYTRGWQTYVYRSFIAMSSRALKGPSMVWYWKFATGTSVSYPFTHIVITGTKTDAKHTTINFYVDGVAGKTFMMEGKLPGRSNGLTVGNFASNEGQQFHGIIDEIKILPVQENLWANSSCGRLPRL